MDANLDSSSTISKVGIQVEAGMFDGLVPYVKLGSGPRAVAFLLGGGALLMPPHKRPSTVMATYGKYLSPSNTFYLLGYRDLLSDTITFDQIVDDLASAIQAHIGSHVPVVGISFGGAVALRLVVRYPDLASRLILWSSAHANTTRAREILAGWRKCDRQSHYRALITNLGNEAASPFKQFKTWLATVKKWKTIEPALAPVASVARAGKILLSIGDSLRQDLPAIKVPTLIFGGTRDPMYLESIYRETASLIPGAKLVLYDGAGHDLRETHADQFKRDLIDALNVVPSGE